MVRKMTSLPLDQILQGDCIEMLNTLPEKSIDLIFADPPYNLQLSKELWRPNITKVDAVDDAWDQFSGFPEYDTFSHLWLSACHRVLKDTGAIWVIGTYHNIFRLGSIMQDLGYWILNDIIWVKTNPMPNFRGVRFTNAHETLIWASKYKGARYVFNYHAMKALNDDKQMRSDWVLPTCSGAERIKVEGQKAHATQKPEGLLYRLILASSNPGDIILDPFFGSGTTGAIAKKLHRHWIGIERQAEYVEIARQRITAIMPTEYNQEVYDVRDKRRSAERVPFAELLENGLLQAGQSLYFRQNRALSARIKADGKLIMDGFEGSIHQAGSHLMAGSPCNGWEHWYYEAEDGKLHVIDELRQALQRASHA
jgi:site-specific DNA-methyltransferase (adenine-specific)